MRVVSNGHNSHLVINRASPELMDLLDALVRLDEAWTPETPEDSPVCSREFARIQARVELAIRAFASRGGFCTTIEEAMRMYAIGLGFFERETT